VLQSRITLAEFIEDDWWPRHAIPNLADDTRRRYREIWARTCSTVSAAMC
jgi:hypothetical protein